ncbi:hypothetical protein CMV30_03210 [Nibricoccus aquaticus]|uniref:PBP domain-containing protein n=2 Tax=Nibricoccus aquaticus TaxID=2576891 RepID=A0A290QCJ0_9BACT|nr:hypothetical protein CMV30_03210 [Nibricoccus aquaticus]
MSVGRAETRAEGFFVMRLIVFLALWLVPLIGFSADVRVVGSDLLGADFGTVLEVFSKRENLRLTTAFAGSRAGLDELKAGKADVALVAFAPDEKKPEGSFVALPLAYRIAVVVVPEHIELTQISFKALDGAFGVGGAAGFSLWRDLGAGGAAAPLTVTTHVLAGKGDELSVDLFARTALRVPKLKSSVLRYHDFATLKARLSAEEGGLAVLPYVPPVGGGLRALLVARGEGEPAFGPSAENIHTGDYPLRLPVYVVYRSESAARLRSLLTFLWSDEVAGSLAKNPALMPVPLSGRPQVR